jgi:hypothetical protein
MSFLFELPACLKNPVKNRKCGSLLMLSIRTALLIRIKTVSSCVYDFTVFHKNSKNKCNVSLQWWLVREGAASIKKITNKKNGAKT